eukprot:g2743.t1
MPETCSDGRTLLQTEGLPFSISGVGDLLALFRCISCKYRFDSHPDFPDSMGAIGRVYYYGKPEIRLDLQQSDKTTYLRIKEARVCRIHATMIMPVFLTPDRSSAAAVVEISHDDKSVEFNNVFQLFKESLEMMDLYTAEMQVDNWTLGLRQWPLDISPLPLTTMDNDINSMSYHHPVERTIPRQHSLAKAMQTGFGDVSDFLMNVGMDSLTNRIEGDGFVFGDELLEGCSDSNLERSSCEKTTTMDRRESHHRSRLIKSLSDRSSSNSNNHVIVTANGTIHEEETQHGGCKAQQAVQQQLMTLDKARSNFGPKEATPVAVQDPNMELEPMQEELGTHGKTKGEEQGKKNENRLGGGAGKRLSYSDLEKHFGHGLKDAANRLGICPTTLKRACRRNGITRWPSRQISKLYKIWKQMGYGGKPPTWLLQNAICGNLRSDYLGYILNTGFRTGGAGAGQQSMQNSLTNHHHNQNHHQFQGLEHHQYHNILQNRTHHGAYTAALHGNQSLIFGDHSTPTTMTSNHTWHGGQLMTNDLSSSAFPIQSSNPYLSAISLGFTTTTSAGAGGNESNNNLSCYTSRPDHEELVLSSEMRTAATTTDHHESSSNALSFDMEKTQRSGMALILPTDLAIMEQDDDDLLQQQLTGPLGYENTQHHLF